MTREVYRECNLIIKYVNIKGERTRFHIYLLQLLKRKLKLEGLRNERPVTSHDIMTNITEFEACPLQRGYVVKFGINLQNFDFSSFPVDVGRMFLHLCLSFIKISITHFTKK